MSEPPEEITLDYFAGLQIYRQPYEDLPATVRDSYQTSDKMVEPMTYRLTQVKQDHVWTDFSISPPKVDIGPAWVYRRHRG